MRRISLLLVALLLAGCGLLGPAPLPTTFEVGRDYDVELNLHCGYDEVAPTQLGSEFWLFVGEEEPSDSIVVRGVLRRVSTDEATFTTGGVVHSLRRITEYHTICI